MGRNIKQKFIPHDECLDQISAHVMNKMIILVAPLCIKNHTPLHIKWILAK